MSWWQTRPPDVEFAHGDLIVAPNHIGQFLGHLVAVLEQPGQVAFGAGKFARVASAGFLTANGPLRRYLDMKLKSFSPIKGRAWWERDHCGVRPFGLHVIRVLAGSILAESGEAMVNIASFLRHKNVRTTERYINKLRRLKPTLDILKAGLEMVKTEPAENRPTSILRLAGGSK